MVFVYLAVTAILTIFLLVLSLIMLVKLLAVFYTNAPFIPISRKIEKEIVKSLNLKDGSVLFDLGCGDGRVLIKAVQTFPNIKAVGVEVALWPYFLVKLKSRKYKNIEIIRENIFNTDLSSATHIFMYLSPPATILLFARIREQCKTGTTVVSCDFELKNIMPTKVVNLENINPTSPRGKKLFVYII